LPSQQSAREENKRIPQRIPLHHAYSVRSQITPKSLRQNSSKEAVYRPVKKKNKQTNKQILGKSQKSELDLSTYNAARLAGGYRIQETFV